jgi:hypothetical protein
MNKRIFAKNKYFHNYFTIVNKVPNVADFFEIDYYNDYPKYENIKEVIIQVDEFEDMIPEYPSDIDKYMYYRIITTEDGDGGADRFLEFFIAVKKEVI